MKIAAVASVRPIAPDVGSPDPRSDAANFVLITLSIVQALATALGLYRVTYLGWQPFFTAQIAIALLLGGIVVMRRRVPYTIRAFVILVAYYAMGTIGQLAFGTTTNAPMALLAFSSLALFFFGYPTGVMALLLAVATFLVIQLAHNRGLISFVDLTQSPFPLRAAVTASAGMALSGFMPMIALRKFSLTLGEVRQYEAQLAAIVEGSDDAIVSKTLDGNITSWNRGAVRLFGYEREEMIGNSIKRLVPRELYGEEDDIIAQLTQGHSIGRFETVRITKEGKRIDVSVAISPIRNAEGQVVGASKIVRDITEIKRAQGRAREAQKMEAFGRLASGIAHDFNNILGIINSSAEILQDQKNRQQDFSVGTRLILRACERGADLTRRLLIFSRKSVTAPTHLNVLEVLNELVEVLRRTIGANIAVSIIAKCEAPYVFVDPSQFHTALFNLAINAKDAMPRGGTLSFEVDCQRADLGEEQGADIILISARDNGTGMPPEVVQKVFEPFFTTKEIGKGTGLGLSMVYGFVAEAGGEISVESAVGEGTVFTLKFPASSPPRSSQEGDKMKVSSGSEGLRVLLVEDDEDLREVTTIQLRRMGLAVEAAPTAEDALAIASADKEFDVLVTDFQLGGPITGVALARELESKLPGIFTIIVSGYLSPEDAETLDDRWFALEKPITHNDLMRTIKLARTAKRRMDIVPS